MGQDGTGGTIGVAQREAWRSGRVPPVEEVHDGVWAIPLPLPGHPMRYTFCYALRHGSGLLLIDPGYHDRRSWEALEAGLARAGARPAEVTGVLLTHAHPDHVGQARRVRDAGGAWIAIHSGDMAGERLGNAEYVRHVRGILAVCGVPVGLSDLMTSPLPPLIAEMVLLRPDRELFDGQVVTEGGLSLEVVATPGHTPGHVCFLERERGLLFTGDHLLPRIRSSVSVLPSAPDPLKDFTASLERVAALGAVQALPAHEYRFGHIEERVAQIQEGLRRRSAEVAEAVRAAGSATAWEVFPLLHWSRRWEEAAPDTPVGAESRRFMTVETLSHLRRLAARGVLEVAATGAERYRPRLP